MTDYEKMISALDCTEKYYELSNITFDAGKTHYNRIVLTTDKMLCYFDYEKNGVYKDCGMELRESFY